MRSLQADASKKCHSFRKAQMRSVENLETRKRIAGHFAGKYKTETTWKKLNKEGYGIDNYWVFLFTK